METRHQEAARQIKNDMARYYSAVPQMYRRELARRINDGMANYNLTLPAYMLDANIWRTLCTL